MLRTADFEFELPVELIAQKPAAQRDDSRLLVLHRLTNQIEHRQFRDLPEYMRAGDVTVLNNTRVLPARLRGRNTRTWGRFEFLLLSQVAINDWWAMLRPGKRAGVGTEMAVSRKDGSASGVVARVTETNEEGHRRLHFTGVDNITRLLGELGEIPLPPYIERRCEREDDYHRYQTIFAQHDGSVAAPTAGLHFTPSILNELRRRGIRSAFLTLHVGLGTFAPVKAEFLQDHRMHKEWFDLPEETARLITAAKADGGRVLAIGTTTLRVLETQAIAETVPASNMPRRGVKPGSGQTEIFIYPPYEPKVVDMLLTNFHLPRSTLLMLVSAFAMPNEMRGREMLLAAYEEAIRRRYRFYSYGDAMLIL